MPRLSYLCLQVTREGQASHAHVHEIIGGLRRLGWKAELYEPYHGSETAGAFRRAIRFLQLEMKMMLHIRKADVVYIRSHFAALPVSIVARLAGYPVVQEINGPHEDLFIAWPWTRRFSRLFTWMNTIQWRMADKCITVTEELRTWLQPQAPRADIAVVPNGANTQVFFPEAILHNTVPEKYAVFFGSLAPWQGIDTVLEAVSLNEWPSGLNLVICGQGQERPRVEAAAISNDRIHYVGQVPYKHVAGIVACSLAALCPKNDQGDRQNTGLMPLKLFETMACGVPVIATDFPGQAGIVRDNECGIVIPASDPVSLANAVAAINAMPDEQRRAMGERGRQAIVNEHSWEKRAADTDGLLRSIIETRGKPCRPDC